MSENSFHWFDYVVFSVTLLVSVGIGVFQACTGGKQKSTKEYLLGNKQMKVLPVAMSMLMSGLSAISVLGNPAEYYIYGTQAYITSFVSIITGIMSAHLFIPMVYPLGIVSIFQYHEKRFKSKFIRKFAALVSILYLTLYLGMVAYAPSSALEAVTGFPLWAFILATAGLGTVYTCIGGMKAVIWTDFFQGLVLFIGLIAVIIMGAIEVGGLGNVFSISKDNGRIIFFNMDPDPTVRNSFWACTIPAFITGLTGAVASQTTVQRYLSTGNVRDAKWTLVAQVCLSLIVDTLLLFVGLTLFAYYENLGCDPYRSGQVDSTNQLLPKFVIEVLGVPGFPGLFIAVLMSGALSSISSSLSSITAMTWKDFLEPCFPKVKEITKTLISKIIVIIAGCISVITAFLIANLESGIYTIAISIIGGFTGPLAGMIFLGAVFPWAQWKGATIGLAAGVAMTLWINTGYYSVYPHREYLYTNVDNCTFQGNDTVAEIPEDPEDVFWLYSLSTWYIGLVGWATSLIVGLLTSFITCPEKPSSVDSRLMIPLPDRLCCCCLDGTCYCGVAILTGGMKAVIWTDFFQGLVLFIGLLAVIIMGAIEVGGLGNVFSISKDNGRIIFFNMDPDPTVRNSFWACTIPAFITGLTGAVASQTIVQRYLSTGNVRDAKLTIVTQVCLSLFAYTLLLFVGLTLFAYYENLGCDPYRSGQVDSTNQLLPKFAVDVLGMPGFPGLFIAVLMSGALSSISSSLSSITAMTWKDFLEPYFPQVKEITKTLISKIIVIIAGSISVITAFLIANLESGIYTIALSITGGFVGPLSAMIFLAAVFPWVQWKGATIGLAAGVAMTLWINTGYYSVYPHREYLYTNVDNCTFQGNDTAAEMPEDPEDVFWLYSLSTWYIGLVGWVTSVIVGLLSSFITCPEKPSSVDSRLMIPLPDRLCCCCLDGTCYCGVDYSTLDYEDMSREGSIQKLPSAHDDVQEIKEIHRFTSPQEENISREDLKDTGRDHVAFVISDPDMITKM